MTTLLSNAGKGATSNEYELVSDSVCFMFEGDFSGESAYIQRKTVAGTFQTLEDGTITYATEKIIRLARGVVVRVATSNGAGTPSITASVAKRDS